MLDPLKMYPVPGKVLDALAKHAEVVLVEAPDGLGFTIHRAKVSPWASIGIALFYVVVPTLLAAVAGMLVGVGVWGFRLIVG